MSTPQRDPDDILNWRRIDPRTTLSGQPSEAQLARLRDLGVTHVINLAPHTNRGALDDEPGTVAALDMTYIHIPVDFAAPTEADYTAFCTALQKVGDATLHVHCIYNARVSAFFYRYAGSGIRGGSKSDAFALMDGIWRPGGVWATFIGDEDAASEPNRYAGDDY